MDKVRAEIEMGKPCRDLNTKAEPFYPSKPGEKSGLLLARDNHLVKLPEAGRLRAPPWSTIAPLDERPDLGLG